MNRPIDRLRFVSRRSGIVALIATALFVTALLQAGVLHDLFRSELKLRVILPDSGLAGLSAGATVEVLGTPAGRVAEIVLKPDTRFYADVRIDKSMEPFVRADSVVSIRKQFGIAGASFLEIARGNGTPLDWDYAVLTAQVETAPTANVGELLEDLREKALPILTDTHRAIAAAAVILERLGDPKGDLEVALGNLTSLTTYIAEGKGNLGRLIREDRLSRDVEGTVSQLNQTLSSFSVIVTNLQTTSSEAAAMMEGFGAQSKKLPDLIDQTGATLRSLNKVMAEISRTMPAVTSMVRNSADASEALPTLLVQTQQTLSEVERILVQLRGSWLLGGGGNGSPERLQRLSPVEARP
jgi:phospholipid/cholesterol/gamma-HCH transport system substrate-binding protein